MNKNHLSEFIRAAYPLLLVKSEEPDRAEAAIAAASALTERECYRWDPSGAKVVVRSTGVEAFSGDGTLGGLLRVATEKVNKRATIVVPDGHMCLSENTDQLTVRDVRKAIPVLKSKGITVCLIGCRAMIPPELERDIAVVETGLPTPADLRVVLDGLMQSVSLPVDEAASAECIRAAAGLTLAEAENAFARVLVRTKQEDGFPRLDAKLVSRFKAEQLAKNGLARVIDTDGLTEDDIGGLDNLKAWLRRRSRAFSVAGQEAGLPSPKGVVCAGIPGTGKSLTAKVCGAIFKVPTLQVDVGSLFGSLLGESEAKMDSVLRLAEAMAPCALFFDELEKGFSGMASGSGATDQGVGKRMFGKLLAWLNDKTAPVFVIATANDISQLPPEFLRRGRFDEVFFVDLPNDEEREAILRIHLAKAGIDIPDYEIPTLVSATIDMVGAEIASAIEAARFDAFDANQKVDSMFIIGALGMVKPIARVRSDSLSRLREWGCNNAVPATSPKTQVLASTRNL